MATFTWNGGSAASTFTADWSPQGSPAAGDTAILANGGTILLGDGHFQSNTWSLGNGLLVFAGDSLVNLGTPDLDAASLITTNTGSSAAQASTIDAFGNFVNEGTILADGASGSSLTINIGTAVFNGTSVAGYSYNTGLIQADAGNTLTINAGATSELFSSGSIVADGGDVIIKGASSAIASGFAPVRGMMIIEGGGTIETNAAYASTVAGTREQYYFEDSAPGNTLKIDNAGSFNGSIYGFGSGDTIDLGTNLGTVTTLIYSLATNFLCLESIAAGVTTVLATVLIGNTGSVGFSSGTFTVNGGTADGFILGTVVTNGTTDTALTTALTPLFSGNVSGVWQDSGSWQSGVPGTGSSPIVGAGATAPFTLTTGFSSVSVGGFTIVNPLATVEITSNTTTTTGTISDYNGTLDVEAGNTLTSGALLLTEPSAASTIAAGAILDLSGRLTPNLAPISNVWGTQAGNNFAFAIAAGSVEVDGAVLAGPALTGGGGGSTQIGYDSNTSATVTVNAGGTVTDAHSLLGSDPGSSGTLTLNGIGASWTDAVDSTDTGHQTGYLLVGYDDLSANTPSPAQSAAARLLIENGATMTTQEGADIGDSLDSAGTVTVTNGGVWDLVNNSSIVSNGATITNVNAGYMAVGNAGNGVVSVLNGGTVNVGANGTFYGTGTTFIAGGIGIGQSIGATGTVIVSGVGSELSSLNGMAIAKSGQGLLSIINGGTVLINGAGAGVGVGQTAGAGSSGTIDVGGSGAAAAFDFTAAAGGLTVGNVSTGVMNVSDNGTVNIDTSSGFFSIGSSSGSVGSVVVGGTTVAAVINIGTRGITVGFQGSGALTVNQLGTISMTGTNAIGIGQSLGGTGVVTVNGGLITEGATTGGFTVGFTAGATGTVLVENSGTVLLAGGGIGIANGPSASGAVTITSGALVNETRSGVNVGGSGHGTLTVSNAGSLVMNGTASVNVDSTDGTASQMTVAGGTVAFTDTTNFGMTVGNSGRGTLDVSDFGTNVGSLTTDGYIGIGNSIASNGSVIVGGTSVSAVISDSGTGINVGNLGTGGLTVNRLGTIAITGTGGIAVGFGVGSSGTMTVNAGDVTEDLLSNGINIGQAGNGTLTVNNGGSIAMNGTGGIGIGNGGTGQLTVAGGSVIFNDATNFGIGVANSGSGLLMVSDNGIIDINANGVGNGGLEIANASGAHGTVVVGGSSAAAVINLGGGGLGVGNSGTGALTVNSLGTVALTGTAGITVGFTTGAVGVMTVNDGLISAGSASFGINVGFNSNATGSFLIENGGTVALAGGGVNLANGPTSTAAVTITGAGSKLTDGGFVTVGGAGDGALTVSNGGSLAMTGTGFLTVGANSGGTGRMTVSGASVSLASSAGGVVVGNAGSGTLTVENNGVVSDSGGLRSGGSSGGTGVVTVEGGTLAAVAIDVGQGSGGSGTITVTGTRSLLSGSGFFVVGDSGEGVLSIGANGIVTAAAGLTIANTSGASGSSVNVSGAASNLTVTGALVVGASGFGSLSLSQGAAVTAGALDVASGATGDGAVSLAGTGTTLDVNGALTLGDQAAGELSILGGAQMTIGGGVVGGTSGAGGNLDIEGNGSQLTINGGTLVVGANGPAEFTLGIGATLTGEVSTDLFGVTNEYGNVDPATDPVVGTQNVGFGSSSSYDFFVANSGTIKITGGTATFYTPLVTFQTKAQGDSVNGLWVIGASDTLVMNATSVDNSQTFDLTSASGATLVIGQVPAGNPNAPDTFNGQTMPTLTGSIAPGAANVLAGWDAPIENYASGDVITLRGLTYGSATALGDVVTVWSGPAGTGNDLGSLTFIDKSDSTDSIAAVAQAALAAAQINALACFVAGTRIETADGWVKVEDLTVGDEVRTADGRCEPIVWVGSRAVDCARHPKPETVWPVRVRAGAFGENVPVRDLFLSPDHAVFVNDVLVPVKLLINRTSITQVKRNHVVYHHVELPEHTVILAEGLKVESYLDTGDRADFAGGGTIRLYPDFATRPNAARTWETKGAARLVMAGEEVDAARRTVLENAPRRRLRSAGSALPVG